MESIDKNKLHINFISYIDNKFISCGEYTNSKILEYPPSLIQMKIENDNLLIIASIKTGPDDAPENYFVAEKMTINNGIYTFTKIRRKTF